MKKAILANKYACFGLGIGQQVTSAHTDHPQLTQQPTRNELTAVIRSFQPDRQVLRRARIGRRPICPTWQPAGPQPWSQLERHVIVILVDGQQLDRNDCEVSAQQAIALTGVDHDREPHHNGGS